MIIRTLAPLALIAALAACTPSTNTEVATVPPAGAPPAAPPADIAAPAPDTGPAAANTTDTLTSSPAPAASTAPTPATAPAVTPAPAPQAPAGATKAELDAGSAVYARTCAMCHGPSGQGVPNMGVALATKDVAAIKEKVTKGTVKAGDKMPPMGATLSASDLDAVAKFVAAGLPQ